MPQIAKWKTAAISFSSSGDNTCIAAVTGMPINVWKIWFTAANAVNVTFKDGASTSLSGAAILTSNGSSFFAVYDGSPWWVTSPGNAFVINLSGAVALTGQVYYSLD
jgi:hypothetical protein